MFDHRIADVRDADSLAGAIRDFKPEIVIHLAAQSLVRRSYRDPLETLQVNVLGAANLLEACRAADGIRAVGVELGCPELSSPSDIPTLPGATGAGGMAPGLFPGRRFRRTGPGIELQ